MTDVLDEDVKQALAILRSVNRVVGMSAKPLADDEYTVELPNGKAVLLKTKGGECIRADVLDKDEEPAPPAMLDKEGKPIEAGWYLRAVGEEVAIVRVFYARDSYWRFDPYFPETKQLTQEAASMLLKAR